MKEVTDDQDSAKGLPIAGTRRVPVYVAVVLSCTLLGYAISIVMPLHFTPTTPAGGQSAAAALLVKLETTLVATSTTAARTTRSPDLTRHSGQAEPADVQSPASPQTPAVETGSVDHPPQPPREAEASEVGLASTAKTQEAGRAESPRPPSEDGS